MPRCQSCPRTLGPARSGWRCWGRRLREGGMLHSRSPCRASCTRCTAALPVAWSHGRRRRGLLTGTSRRSWRPGSRSWPRCRSPSPARSSRRPSRRPCSRTPRRATRTPRRRCRRTSPSSTPRRPRAWPRRTSGRPGWPCALRSSTASRRRWPSSRATRRGSSSRGPCSPAYPPSCRRPPARRRRPWRGRAGSCGSRPGAAGACGSRRWLPPWGLGAAWVMWGTSTKSSRPLTPCSQPCTQRRLTTSGRLTIARTRPMPSR
mmetsp:Transcript_75857/g.222365  ORF Transcript_75857/g.222365 Transcript_75857/m.222365 type:complete len:261 (-) Transcript_75857:918-1700(-)